MKRILNCKKCKYQNWDGFGSDGDYIEFEICDKGHELYPEEDCKDFTTYGYRWIYDKEGTRRETKKEWIDYEE